MRRLVVDTGVFSASLSLRRRRQFERHVNVLAGQQLFLAAQTVAELQYGAIVADGARRGGDDSRMLLPSPGDLAGTRFESEEFARLLFSTPIPDQFADLAAVMGCGVDSERTQTSTDVFTTTYAGCDDGVPVVFKEVDGGGHAWPSSPLTEPDSPIVEQLTALQGYSTFEIDATADSWAFFEQHTRTT